MRRVVRAELLDSDAGTPEEVAQSLADLRRVNRWFGGVRTTARLLERVAQASGRRELAVLDVGSGSGDVPRDAARRLARGGVQLRVTLLDRAITHLPVGERAVVGDALRLPFADGSFDAVVSSLLAHHLEPDELREFLRESLRVARLAAVVNDLRRSWMHLALVYAGFPLYRSRLTRHDAPASVRRAYTPQELAQIAGSAGAERVEVSRHYLCRVGVIVWR